MPIQTSAPKGDLTRNEMRAHLALGRSILISPKFGKDEDGNMVQLQEGRHIARLADLPGEAELSTDPAVLRAAKAEAQARAERAQADIAAIEKAETKAATPPATDPAFDAPKDKTPKGK